MDDPEILATLSAALDRIAALEERLAAHEELIRASGEHLPAPATNGGGGYRRVDYAPGMWFVAHEDDDPDTLARVFRDVANGDLPGMPSWPGSPSGPAAG